ncbi:hypothetical protein G3T14_13135 [Methylobacterium sp. BTF04]|uniref:hypothetical protein n=1 Tax=Methylobacterium sp. BTF04 TaxID=2708300 RepID=UPI0013D3CB96|nr:hypothetical protein [Methylobacterium sp. BTF04]NEU13077.1 hypothetical protein [Methylobacterium sp. BTF04]
MIGSLLWENDKNGARIFLEKNIEKVSRLDPLLAGWHNIWLGGLYEQAGDFGSADVAYQRARARLGTNIFLPKHDKDQVVSANQVDPFSSSVFGIVGLSSGEAFNRELLKLTNRFDALKGGTPSQMEEAVRALGEFLGFDSSRPDNDFNTGPDVLWIDRTNSVAVALELKTDKNDPATYFKKDISQCHDHISWVSSEKPEVNLSVLYIVGPSGKCDVQANPISQMELLNPIHLSSLSEEIIAIIKDIRMALPLERLEKPRLKCNGFAWSLKEIAMRFKSTKILNIR